MREPHSSKVIRGLVIVSDDADSPRWERVQSSWPDWADFPDATMISVQDLMRERSHLRARAVLIDVHDALNVFQTVDVLRDAGIPSVLLIDSPSYEKTCAACPGVIVVPDDADPSHAAIALHALMERQSAFDNVQRELDVSRRFQGGLRGEMDKIHEELQLAASVQQELLPRTLPKVPGLELSVLFRPASYVSGDIYDVARLDEHRTAFFLADAVGHGVPAALMTMVIARGMQFKTITEQGYDLRTPGETLEQLNRELVRRHSNSPRFATAVAGVFDERTREVTLAGAGHPPALIYGPGDSVRGIDSEGGLLGIFEEDTFDDVTFTLEMGETLVLYSDGFETAFPDHASDPNHHRLATRAYERRFAELAQSRLDTSAEEAVGGLRAELDNASGSLHQIDDITAIVLGLSAEVESQAPDGDASRQAA